MLRKFNRFSYPFEEEHGHKGDPGHENLDGVQFNDKRSPQFFRKNIINFSEKQVQIVFLARLHELIEPGDILAKVSEHYPLGHGTVLPLIRVELPKIGGPEVPVHPQWHEEEDKLRLQFLVFFVVTKLKGFFQGNEIFDELAFNLNKINKISTSFPHLVQPVVPEILLLV